MLHHHVAKDESSDLQHSGKQLLIIMRMFERISCGYQNQFIIMSNVNLFKVKAIF